MSDEPTRDVLLEQAAEEARRLVAQGFDPADEIVETVAESLRYELSEIGEPHGDDVETWVAGQVAAAVEAHLASQATWPPRTDCDRLDDAFAALAKVGVVARQNFTCCQSCGHAEIWDEIREVHERGDPVSGYTFFHMQDTEGAEEYGSLYLAYGAALGPEEDEDSLEERALGVGREVVRALEASGLSVSWNGTTSQRICVTDLDWKRRR